MNTDNIDSTELAILDQYPTGSEDTYRESEEVVLRSQSAAFAAERGQSKLRQAAEQAVKVKQATTQAIQSLEKRLAERDRRISDLSRDLTARDVTIRRMGEEAEERNRKHERDLDDIRLVSSRELSRQADEMRAEFAEERRALEERVEEHGRVLRLAGNEIVHLRASYSNLREVNLVMTQAFNDITDGTSMVETSLSGVMQDLDQISGRVNSEIADEVGDDGPQRLLAILPEDSASTPVLGLDETPAPVSEDTISEVERMEAPADEGNERSVPVVGYVGPANNVVDIRPTPVDSDVDDVDVDMGDFERELEGAVFSIGARS